MSHDPGPGPASARDAVAPDDAAGGRRLPPAVVRLVRSPWPRLGLLVVLLGAAAVLAATGGTAVIAGARDTVAGLAAWAPPVFVLLYAAATVAVLPVSLLSLAAGLLFGPVVGVVVVWVGAMLGAGASFAIGRVLSRPAVEELAGERLERLDRFLARRGFLAVLVVRLIPLFSFVLVNYGASATGVRPRSYLAGTALGVLPGVVVLVTLGGTAASPTSPAFLAAAGGLLVLTVGGSLVARRLRRPDA